MHKILLLTSALVLSGCGTTSKIAPYGQDTYVISVASRTGTTERSELRVKAAQNANTHCVGLGKKMKVEKAEDRGVAWLTSTSSQLIFSCV